MSPRPRKVSDEEIYAATLRAMGRVGPGELTLAEIAAEAGVTAGAVAQRFGSKRDLLLAVAGRGADGSEEFLRSLRERHRSPIAAVRAYAAGMAHLASSPAALARNLAYLQIDVADADFRVHLVMQARSTRAWLESVLREALASGELAPRTDTRALARTVEVALNGSLFTWAILQEGTAERWIRTNIDAVLRPHLAGQDRQRSATAASR